ncbi:ArdC-like ssDNA-binding domain-containing protein [Bradyrhizobium brasilense]|nr:ArdC-like ssDNA-binding domain-containing protein [Bradyrhizobium australafricanum]WFU33662.1 ArdC-like ssDNA-binding domain-containing protein [Bradyrhizobium australafricanum]
MRHSLTRRDVYQTITNQIIAELERGVRPWIKPWSASPERLVRWTDSDP